MDIRRYEKAICELEAIPAPEGAVLLYGSSTIRLWPEERLRTDLAPYTILARGFGGSTAEEALFYYDRMVLPCRPKVLVWYEGDNDPNYGYSARRCMKLSERVFRRARVDLPGIRIVILGIKLSGDHPEADAVRRETTRLYRKYAASHADTFFVDTAGLVSTPSGEPIPAYYREDRLHLSEDGYRLLGSALKAVLDGLER